MYCFPARWTKSLAAAALVTLPLAASAQTTTPAQTTPPAQTQNTKVDAAASKQHLSAARDTLSQLTALPEAARIQGDARNQVSQIISGFNELITTQSDWRSAYAKVDAGLTAVLGAETAEPTPPPATPPAAGVTGAVGTSGAAAATLDPAVRAKLVEFRGHLKEFERAAGGSASPAMAPSVATDTTSNPAPATGTMTGTTTGHAAITTGNPTAAATAPTTTPAMIPSMTPAAADQDKAAVQAGHSEADKHLDAISAILDQSKTGTLTKAQTAALKKHVGELRVLLSTSIK